MGNFNGTIGDDHLISTYAGSWMINPAANGGSLCYGATQGTTAYACVGSLTYPTGWFLLTVVRNNTNFSVYFNDQLQGSNSNSNFTSDTVVGMIGSSAAGKWTHAVSNLTLFNTSLPLTGSNSITTLYNNGTPLSSMSGFSSLQGWWKLIGGGTYDSSGLRMPDYSSNSNTTESTLTLTPSSIETGFVNKLTGNSSGMSQSNLVQSDLQTVAPYSKYAMNFRGDPDDDYIQVGTSDAFSLTDMTISFWFNASSVVGSTRWIWQKCQSTATNNYGVYVYQVGSTKYVILWDDIDNRGTAPFLAEINENQWYNVTITMESLVSKMYLNGSSVPVYAGRSATASDNLASITAPFRIGINVPSTVEFFQGSISNGSVWNAALTSAQVTEIYNEGLPSNLNSHSAYSNLVSWWQLGSNSSFNGNDWIVADEIGSNNGESDGMGVDALTNGVGTTANGVSTGMSVGALVGNAPYSTANAISSGMPVTARGTNVP